MSNVKIKEIPYNERYVHLAIDKNVLIGPMTANLKCLYEFINRNSPGNSCFQYGNAARAILKKARALAGSRRYIISKKQVLSLVRAEGEEYAVSIKIPYASDYIFKAIFEIFEGYKNDPVVSVPTEILSLYGKIRREVFFGIQSEQYKYKHNHNLLNKRDDLGEIRKALVNDLCSDECALGKQV